MTERIIQKNIKLHRSFDKYLWKNPELLDQIPNKSLVYLTVKGEPYFNRVSRLTARSIKGKLGKTVEARKEGTKWKILAIDHK